MPTAPHAGSLRPRWPPDLHRRPPAAPAAIVPARNRPRERASRRHHASRPPATTMSPPAAVPTNSNTPPITQNTRPVRLLINHGQTIESWWERFSTNTQPALTPELVLSGRAD